MCSYDDSYRYSREKQLRIFFRHHRVLLQVGGDSAAAEWTMDVQLVSARLQLSLVGFGEILPVQKLYFAGHESVAPTWWKLGVHV